MADTPAVLTAIADTADRICGIVAAEGQTQSSKISGDVKAELSGLARRLASVGISGAGDITSSSYQGILQQDLPIALKDVRECKLKIFDKLAGTLLPGVAAPSSAQAPPADLLQSPLLAPVIESAANYGGGNIGLYSCVNAHSQSTTSGGAIISINCYGIFTRTNQGHEDYPIDYLFPEDTRLVDNFHLNHRLKRAFFLDGLGNHQKTVDISTDESIWWMLEFEPGPRQPSSTRLIFRDQQFRSPVN